MIKTRNSFKYFLPIGVILLIITLMGSGCRSKKTNIDQTGTVKEQVWCDIKGNISSSGEKIYHLPECQSYSKTIIDESAGERWFCSESEALSAGWRKARNCY